jgi:hypothetical protein
MLHVKKHGRHCGQTPKSRRCDRPGEEAAGRQAEAGPGPQGSSPSRGEGAVMKGTLRAVPGCAGELFPAGSETASPVVAAHPAPTGRHAEPGESLSVSRRSVVGTMIAALAPAAGTAVALPTSSGRLTRSPRRLAVDRALRRRRSPAARHRLLATPHPLCRRPSVSGPLGRLRPLQGRPIRPGRLGANSAGLDWYQSPLSNHGHFLALRKLLIAAKRVL